MCWRGGCSRKEAEQGKDNRERVEESDVVDKSGAGATYSVFSEGLCEEFNSAMK